MADEPVKKSINWMMIFWVVVGFLIVAYFLNR